MKQILMILASKEFRDIEYITPRAFFEQAGFVVKTASSSKVSVGRFGYRHENDFLVEEVDPAQFDGLFLVGGKGALEFIENESAKNIALTLHKEDKPLGAICAAPRNFLHWGLLKGKKATGHNWDGNFEHLCEEFGALSRVRQATKIAGKILTANGPEASEESALRFIKLFN